jgi:hypothetical protein
MLCSVEADCTQLHSSEIDKNKLPQRVAQAEKAVVLRAQELFQAAGRQPANLVPRAESMLALQDKEETYVLG